MATKKTPTKKKTVTSQKIISLYMDFVLENGHEPASIYKFCKDNKFEESDFYSHFGSFEGLKQYIWVAFFHNTTEVLYKNKDFISYPNKEKMLSFFFTLFEVMTANRSYVLFALKKEGNFKGLSQLKGLRTKIKSFAAELIEAANDEKNSRLTKNPVSIFSEGAWVQFLFLLKYWMDDNSRNFEQTDVAIEKSVRAIFDVFETTPLESVFDFGKFLFKENFSKA